MDTHDEQFWEAAQKHLIDEILFGFVMSSFMELCPPIKFEQQILIGALKLSLTQCCWLEPAAANFLSKIGLALIFTDRFEAASEVLHASAFRFMSQNNLRQAQRIRAYFAYCHVFTGELSLAFSIASEIWSC